MYRDSRGLVITAGCSDSADRLDGAVDAYLGARRDTLERVETLTSSDSGCVLGHCLHGYLQMHRCRPEAAVLAVESLGRARKAAQNSLANVREGMHIRALQSWTEGDLISTLNLWEAILIDHPRDILAIRLAQFMTSYFGNSQGIRTSIERVFSKWDEEVPGYNYLLGCYAYGLEETGDYARAERLGRAAVEKNPQDLWAAHAVAHVMEMDGRPRQGIEWITNQQNHWDNCNNFALHLKWHRALYHLSLEDYDSVLVLYDREVRVEHTDEYLDIANAASILWRLEQAGINVGERWQELADRAAHHLDDHFFVFADLHYMIAAAAGPAAISEKFLQSCAVFAKSGHATQSRIMDEVGLAIAQAILANRQGRYSDAVDHLLSRRHLMHRVGGSHAQRDTFQLLLIDSAVRAGRHEEALLLLKDRTSLRPHDLWSWRTLANVAQSAGHEGRAEVARNRLESLAAKNSLQKSGTSHQREAE